MGIVSGARARMREGRGARAIVFNIRHWQDIPYIQIDKTAAYCLYSVYAILGLYDRGSRIGLD